jgi:hypothetical protein
MGATFEGRQTALASPALGPLVWEKESPPDSAHANLFSNHQPALGHPLC